MTATHDKSIYNCYTQALCSYCFHVAILVSFICVFAYVYERLSSQLQFPAPFISGWIWRRHYEIGRTLIWCKTKSENWSAEKKKRILYFDVFMVTVSSLFEKKCIQIFGFDCISHIRRCLIFSALNWTDYIRWKFVCLSFFKINTIRSTFSTTFRCTYIAPV